MEFLTIREFATSLRSSQEKLDRDGKVVLTNNGKPIALMLKIEQHNFENVLKLTNQIEEIQKKADIQAKKRNTFDTVINKFKDENDDEFIQQFDAALSDRPKIARDIEL